MIYALAHRLIDPTQQTMIDYPWFKFIHGKSSVNEISVAADQYNYLYPAKLRDRIYLGGKRLDRIWHYHDKKLMDILNG